MSLKSTIKVQNAPLSALQKRAIEQFKKAEGSLRKARITVTSPFDDEIPAEAEDRMRSESGGACAMKTGVILVWTGIILARTGPKPRHPQVKHVNNRPGYQDGWYFSDEFDEYVGPYATEARGYNAFKRYFRSSK